MSQINLKIKDEVGFSNYHALWDTLYLSLLINSGPPENYFTSEENENADLNKNYFFMTGLLTLHKKQFFSGPRYGTSVL